MKLVKTALALSVLFAATTTHAAENTVNLSTAMVAVDPNFFYVYSTSAFCGGRFAYPLANPGAAQLYSTILAAKLAGKTMIIAGSGACNVSASEGITWLKVP